MQYRLQNGLYKSFGLLVSIWLWSLVSAVPAYASDIRLEIYQQFATEQLFAGTLGNQLGLQVINNGAAIAHNVIISSTIDSLLAVTDVDCGTGADQSQGQMIFCAYPTMPASGGSATVIITFDVDKSAETGLIFNSATAQATSSADMAVDMPVNMTTDENGEIFTAHTAKEIAVINQRKLALEQYFVDEQIIAEDDILHIFTLVVGNPNSHDADDVQVQSQVDERLQLAAVDCGMGINNSQGQNIDCTYLTIRSMSSAIITATYATASGIEPGLVKSYATATDSLGGLVESWDQVIINRKVALELTHHFVDREVSTGSVDHIFTITAGNHGPSDSHNVRIKNRVDDRLMITDVDCGAGINTSQKQQIECTYDILLANGPATIITVTYGVGEDAEPGMVFNRVTMMDQDQYTMEFSHNVEIVKDLYNLIALIDFLPATVMAGSMGNHFAITAHNSGEADAQQVQLVSNVDPRLAVTTVDCGSGEDGTQGQQVRCTYGTLPTQSSTKMTVTYAVDSDVEHGRVFNNATVQDGHGNTFATFGTVDILYDMALDLENRFYDQMVIVGSIGRILNITARNQGASDLRTVQVTNDMDPFLLVTAVDCGSGANGSNGQLIDCTHPLIAGGDSATITVTYDVAEVVPVESITNMAFARDEMGNKADSVDMITVMEGLELDVRQRFAHSTVLQGSTEETFTIFVGNPSDYDVHDMEIYSQVDPHLAVSAVDCGRGQDISQGQRVECIYETLPANGGEAMIIVTYSVADDASMNTVLNRADVFYAGNNHIQMDASVQIVGLDGEQNPIQNVKSTPFTVAEGVPAQATPIATSVPTAVVMPQTEFQATPIATYMPTPIATPTDVTGEKLNLAAYFVENRVTAGSSDHQMSLMVQNMDLVDVRRVQVTDHFDPRLLILSADCGSGIAAHRGQTVECLYDRIVAGGKVVITVRYAVAEDAEAGVVINKASVQDGAGQLVETESEVTIIADPSDTPTKTDTETESESGVLDDLTQELADENLESESVVLWIESHFADSSVIAGDGSHLLLLTVQNQSNSDAQAAQIINVVDERLQVLTVDCGHGTNQSEGQHVNCVYPTLAAHSTENITVTYETDASLSSSMILNEATVEDQLGNSAESREMLQVMKGVELNLAQNFGDQQLIAGGEYTFTMTLRNLGDIDAVDVVLNSTVNGRLAIEAIHCGSTDVKNINSSSGQTLTCLYPILSAHETTMLTITYKIPVGVIGGEISSMIMAQDGENHNIVEIVELEIVQPNPPGTLKSELENATPWQSPITETEYMIFLPGIFQN